MRIRKSGSLGNNRHSVEIEDSASRCELPPSLETADGETEKAATLALLLDQARGEQCRLGQDKLLCSFFPAAAAIHEPQLKRNRGQLMVQWRPQFSRGLRILTFLSSPVE
jgi:hypothetical protein